MPSPPPSPAASHTSHYVATVVELVLWSLLLWYQGVVETAPRLRIRWDTLCTRVKVRFRNWPRNSAANFALAVGVTGTSVIGAVGYTTGFLHGPHWPPGWQRTLATLAVTLVAPSLIEETLFRGLLLRLADHRGHASVQPQSTAAAGQLNEGLELAASESYADSTRIVPLAELRGVVRRRELLEQLGQSLLFVLYHLDIIHTNPGFRRPMFLVLAAIVGVFCQVACIGTRSIWPGVVMHWLWVAAWKTVA